MRVAVGLAGATFAAVSLACSNASNPLADSKMERNVTVPHGAIPYITGVHVAAIPAFDNEGVEPVAFNDLGEIVGDSVSNVTFGSTIFNGSPTAASRFCISRLIRSPSPTRSRSTIAPK